MVVVVDVVLLVETVVVVETLLCVIRNCCPAITTVVLRGPPGLAATISEMFDGPAPAVGCTVTQSTNRCTVQRHSGPVASATLALPPLTLNEAAPELSP